MGEIFRVAPNALLLSPGPTGGTVVRPGETLPASTLGSGASNPAPVYSAMPYRAGSGVGEAHSEGPIVTAVATGDTVKPAGASWLSWALYAGAALVVFLVALKVLGWPVWGAGLAALAVLAWAWFRRGK